MLSRCLAFGLGILLVCCSFSFCLAAEARLMVASRTVPLVSHSDDGWRAVNWLREGELISVTDSTTVDLAGAKPRPIFRVRPISSQGEQDWLWVSADALDPLSAGDHQLIRDRFKTRLDLPANIRYQPPAIQEAWLEVQEAIAENERQHLRLPDPYFARAEILSIVHDFDSAFRDYLRAIQLAEEAGQDLVQHRAYFARLKQILEQYDSMPRPPVNGSGREHYVQGVHAYWRGNTDEAIQHLTNAIAIEPQQSLHWYFRALAFKRLGDDVRAQHDALMGAHAEWNDGLADSLAPGLQRVQGDMRRWLEQYRRGDPRQLSLAKANRI